MVMPGRFIQADLAKQCVEKFLDTPFEGGRHQARIDAIPVKR
jgi:ribose 5-phosphate isomerase B